MVRASNASASRRCSTGAAIAPKPPKALCAACFKTVDYEQAGAAVAAQVQAEDGVTTAADAIERIAS